MYIVRTCVGKTGPILPEQIGYSSSFNLAEKIAQESQGFVRSINQNVNGDWI